MLYISPDSTYFAGPQLELARGWSEELDGGNIRFNPRPFWRLQPERLAEEDTQLKTRGEARVQFGNQFIDFLPEVATGEVAAVDVATPAVVTLEAYDPWLLATWELIAAHRGLLRGWDGMDALAPSRECLDTAEALANLIAARPMRVRPQFAVDSEGRPSFAAYGEHLYLHLTIDSPNRLSWYAVVKGEDFFEDDVVFKGVEIPAALNRHL
jgi:hypothetical protein